MADGTAPQCGRVGSCHIYYINPSTEMFEGFLILNQEEKSKKAKGKRQNRDLRPDPATAPMTDAPLVVRAPSGHPTSTNGSIYQKVADQIPATSAGMTSAPVNGQSPIWSFSVIDTEGYGAHAAVGEMKTTGTGQQTTTKGDARNPTSEITDLKSLNVVELVAQPAPKLAIYHSKCSASD
jgi:hypothetical protein